MTTISMQPQRKTKHRSRKTFLVLTVVLSSLLLTFKAQKFAAKITISVRQKKQFHSQFGLKHVYGISNSFHDSDENIQDTEFHFDAVEGYAKDGLDLVNKQSTEKRSVVENGNTPDELQQLLEKLKEARLIILDGLKSSFGSYTDLMFNDTTLLNSIIYSLSPLSKDQLKRRLKVKLLQSQLSQRTPSSFTWVTAGHSSAAGHGNLFSQSYTSVLELTVKEIFEIVKIDFRAKNYAMGGTMSGVEVALCMEALFGTDIDILSWDFAMTDNKNKFLWEFWIQRSGMHRTSPILMDFGCHDSINLPMEESGMGIFSFDKTKMQKPIPDSENNLDLAKLPPVLKYYKCGKNIENGELCKKHKFDTKEKCKKVRYQQSFHNGWKDHKIVGTFLAVFIMQNLEESLEELTSMLSYLREKSLSLSSYLNDLLKLDEKDRNKFLISSESKSYGKQTDFGEDNFKLFQRVKTLCHNAQLPSQARFDGLLSQKKKKQGVYRYSGLHENYDKGLEIEELKKKKFSAEVRPLLFAYQKYFRQECQTPLHIDYKDFFYVQNDFGWTGETLPTKAENESLVVVEDWEERKGMVTLCTRLCDWNKCDPGYMFISEVQAKTVAVKSENENNELVTKNITYPANLTIHINDEPVIGATYFFGTCYLLSNKDGYSFPASTKSELKGLYDIRFRVSSTSKFLQITSIIIA